MPERPLVHAKADAIRRLTRRRAGAALGRALSKSSAEDIAEAITHLTSTDTQFLVDKLSDDAAGEVLLTITDDDLDVVLNHVAVDRIAAWLDEMEHDDEADLIERLPDSLRAEVLDRIESSDREQVEELLAYPADSAGGIMAPVAFVLKDTGTCREAIAALQEAGDVEMVFYLYVESDSEQLVGVTSLRNLLLNSPNTPLSEIMETEVISVSPWTDQEEVARIASRYDFLAIPVVDDARKLLGIVTIDDVLDVVREEAAEDMLKMAGVGDSFDVHGTNTVRAARQRLTWLLVTLVGGVGLSEVIGSFEATLAQEAVLAGFIPVVMGIGGNVGIQAATITVRNLATGHVTEGRGAGSLLLREGRVGLLMGLVLSGLLVAYCLVRYTEWQLGAAVGSSILLAVIGSAVLGTLIPLTLDRLRIDPAVATGPFVTTSIDVTAIVLYFSIATWIFGL
ncbi:MAG: magnesium transporter [Alphaproteobacteria bacterium]|nr:magnesium transporter [Alphaproteobacteria bacterium]MCB9796795.1 magnesium transporter [Alphaproteobacteria bacterium]